MALQSIASSSWAPQSGPAASIIHARKAFVGNAELTLPRDDITLVLTRRNDEFTAVLERGTKRLSLALAKSGKVYLDTSYRAHLWLGEAEFDLFGDEAARVATFLTRGGQQ